ncbi:MAG: hypothetical protein ACC700_17515 [Anaerolineales bacterium]
MTETIELKLSVTTNRAEGLVLGDLIAAQDGDLRAMRDTLAHFVVNGTGDYMSQDDYEVTLDGFTHAEPGARTQVSRLTLGQLKFYSKQLQGSLRDEAVPPAKGTVSGLPSDTD